jgi:predicted PurR-regulated permease PerM
MFSARANRSPSSEQSPLLNVIWAMPPRQLVGRTERPQLFKGMHWEMEHSTATKTQKKAASRDNERLAEQKTYSANGEQVIGAVRFHLIARTISVYVVAVVLAVYGLYASKDVLLPLVLAVVLKLLFQPLVHLLSNRVFLPNVLGALAVVIALLATISGLAVAISGPASTWIEKAPQVVPAVKEKFAVLREPIEDLQKSFKEIEEVATPSGDADTPQVAVKQPSAIGAYLAAGAEGMLTRLVTMLVMLFFLLATGDRLLRAFIEILPKFSDKKQTVEIASEIQHQIGAYLLTITGMNLLVGIATATTVKLSGLGDPTLWGTGAFLLNFLPVLGPLLGIGILLLAGIVALDWPWPALMPASLYVLIHVAEGEVITPLLLARRFTLNPVLVILSLFFWYALWGIPGAILAVPLLGTAKIVCDRIEGLKPVGHLLGA